MIIFNRSPKARGFVAVFILMAASVHAAPPSSKASKLDGKASHEMPQHPHERKASEIDTPEYSKEGFEYVAAVATGILESSASAEKEHQAVEQAFLDLDLESICSTEVLLNQSKISEKKDQLKQLLTFLDESESRLGKMLSDLKWQVLSKADVDEDFRKGFAKSYDLNSGENKRLLQEIYALKRDVVWAYIRLFDFVSSKVSAANNHSDLKSVFKSDEELNELQVYLDGVISALKANEEKALAYEQNKEKALNALSVLTHPKESMALIRIAEICKEKIEPYHQACAEINWYNIYTEAVLSNRETIAEKKKELERICPILDEMENKWKKEIPDAVRQTTTPLLQSNQEREILEEFIATVFPLEKECVSIKKKYILEFLQLLNFFSARFGSYKVDTGGVQFAYGIENKLCESYMKNIQQLLQKEESIALQASQLTQILRDRLQHVRSFSSSEQE